MVWIGFKTNSNSFSSAWSVVEVKSESEADATPNKATQLLSIVHLREVPPGAAFLASTTTRD